MDKSGTSLIARALRGDGSSGKPSLARGFRLGTWVVRPEHCLLEADGRSIQLEPKTMGVLLCLAEHAPQVVTREQFIEQVWNGRVVTDEVLSRAVSLLRAVLQDDAQDPRYVRTVPRVGYALIAPVEVLAPREPGARPAKRRGWLIGAAAALVAGLVAAWFLREGGRESPDAPRLAVLALTTPRAGDAGLADGLTEELTVSLARVPGLRVVARNSAMQFKSGDAELGEAAEALGASHLVTGSVRKNGERLRISVHLAEAASGNEIWAETYDRAEADLFGMQADVAAAVAAALKLRPPSDGSAEAPPENPEAYRLYLQGRQQLARRGDEGLRQARSLLEQSIAADPGFLRAQMALAWACTLLANAAPAESAEAITCADRALAALARQTAMSGEMQAVQAWLELERNRWSEAEAAFQAGLAATPDDTEMRLLHSQMLGALGDAPAATREAEQAVANDPLSPAIILRQSVLALWRDDDAAAARLLVKARELGLAPSASPEVPMLLYLRGRKLDALEQALREAQRRRGQSDDWVGAAIAAVRDPARGAAAEAALERAESANQVDGLLHFGALVLAGRDERALRWLLERPRLRTRELEFTLLAREAAGLRRLPGFAQVVTRFGLDTYWDQHGWPAQCARTAGVIACR
jgi:TolB-like protein/DNA-binding winged helix-turn-helix (wHTH) protein